MKIDIEDVMFYMDAIRNSEDKDRTLESFWKGQIRSKLWLIHILEKKIKQENLNIVIHGGWNGVLASLLFNSKLNISKIISIDIDPKCRDIAYTINKRQEIEGRFSAVCNDMTRYSYENVPNIVINTSTEHVTDNQLAQWFERIPTDATVVVQSNNFFSLDEHINCVHNPKQLEEKFNLKNTKDYTLKLPLYNRYMIIGKK
jgi:hypothetical protein